MFCRKCGGQMKDNAKWCPYCGQKVEVTEDTTTQPNDAVIMKEVMIQSNFQAQQNAPVQPQVYVQPNEQVLQPMGGQRQYYQPMPMNQGMQKITANASLTKRGLWGVIGALLFLISIFSEVLILTFEYMDNRSFEMAFQRALQKPYIVMLCVAFATLLLVIFACSKTVLLAALYYFYYYIDMIVQYTKAMEYSEDSMLIKFILTASLALLGLTFLVVNVFLDKRKQFL